MRRRAILLASCMALVMGTACTESGPGDTGQLGQGVEVTASLAEGTDVAGMHFLITPCEGGDPLVNETVMLKGMDLPAGILMIDEPRFDPESNHRFADFFIALPPGCYNVVVQPMQRIEEEWVESEDCQPAHQNDVNVEGELTTEILLISQCMGDEIGGLDVIAALNREPEIDGLVFTPNKFVGDCEGTVVCVTASDPDCDPLQIVWEQIDGTDLAPTPVSFEREGCAVTECVRFQPSSPAAFEYEVTVYDLLISGDATVTIESWLSGHGYPSESHATLRFPMYSDVVCPEPPPPPNPPDCGCTRTQGYWKTHHEFATNPSQNIDWPAPMDELQELCERSLLRILWTAPEGSAFLQLAHQYIAAKLNVAAGACTTVCVDDALAFAEEMLSACVIPVEKRLFARWLAWVLDNYNKGVIGPGHCGCELL